MSIRVAFNATPLLAPVPGIGNYIVNLGAALSESGDVDLYSYYGGGWRHQAPTPPTSASRQRHTRRFRDLAKPLIPFERTLWHATQRLLFARGLRRNAISLYHEPNYVPLSYDVPVVSTVHDLSWLRYPETHPRDRVRWLERSMPDALSRAAAVLVDSEFVRQEVLTTFGVDPARVHTVHLGVSNTFRPRNSAETRATLRALDLEHGRYVLTIGTVEPRKNLRHVLVAHARLPEALRARFPLVIGGAPGWRSSPLEGELRRLAADGRIRFLGHVPGPSLPALYAGAAAFVFPSLYEGFGLPPLEAMASGVPVLVSDRASLPEIVGDAALMLDPERPDDTAVKLASILDDSAAHAGLVRRGLERARAFSWKATARATLDVYRSVVGDLT